VLRFNIGIAIYSWPVPSWLRSSERRWARGQVPPTTLTCFNVSALQSPQIPLPIYVLCLFIGGVSLDIGFMAMSLVYDFLAFSLIVYLAVRSNANKVPIPSLFRTIVQDATSYFLVVFTSHIVIVVFILLASFRIKVLPASENSIVYSSVMITRLLLSLKKASAPQEHAQSLGEQTAHTTMIFAERRDGISTRYGIRLDTFSSAQEGIRSRT